MDLLHLMTKGADPEDLALDRLETIIALFASPEDDVQDEALARAITLCGKQWGGYKAGLEALAKRVEDRTGDPLSASIEALKLREEADDPGMLVRVARVRRSELGRLDGERAAIVARYGSLEDALTLSPVERLFVEAAEHLSDPDEDGAIEPWSSLAGWSLAWHPIPDALRQAVSASACPLPTTVTDARDEALAWEGRKREREILSDGHGEAALPTACAARHALVERLWSRDLCVRDAGELEARMDYWASRGGDDGVGYSILLADFRAIRASGSVSPAQREGTGQRARQLKTDNPDWSLARIGKELGISRQAVHKHLKARVDNSQSV